MNFPETPPHCEDITITNITNGNLCTRHALLKGEETKRCCVQVGIKKKMCACVCVCLTGVCGRGRGRKTECVCACIKIGDFLVRVAGLGISLGSD